MIKRAGEPKKLVVLKGYGHYEACLEEHRPHKGLVDGTAVLGTTRRPLPPPGTAEQRRRRYQFSMHAVAGNAGLGLL